jgi:hypothetical protein
MAEGADLMMVRFVDGRLLDSADVARPKEMVTA